MVYLSLEENEFSIEKIKEASAKAEELGADGTLIFEDEFDKTRIDDYNGDTITVVSESKFGYVAFNIKLDEEDLIHFIELGVKKLNKIKSAIESTK